MLLSFIFLQCFIKVLLPVPSLRLMIVTRIWTSLVRWTGNQPWSRCCWTKSGYFRRECIVHLVLNLWHDLSLLCGVISRARVRIELLSHGSILSCMERCCCVPLMVKLRTVILIVDSWSNCRRSRDFPKLGLSICSLQIYSHLDLGVTIFKNIIL